MAEKRILLVEDGEDAREFLALSLRGAGYSVDAVATAAAANRRLDAVFYALVIADWWLPTETASTWRIARPAFAPRP
jgi:DNA-binding response OmpR family regulator